MSKPAAVFKFRRNDTVGDADGADDELLTKCFVDNGDLEILSSHENPVKILIGRTGSGKTALLRMLREKEQQRVIELAPERLALEFISNNNAIKFLAENGVKLNLFYKMLWRHVIAVAIIKKKFGASPNAWTNLKARFEKSHREALDYFRKYESEFFQSKFAGVDQIVNSFETNFKGEITAKKLGVDLGVTGTKNISQEERQKVVDVGQAVVDSVQLRHLTDVIDLIDEVLEIERYYVVIDRLDEDWVDSSIRYQLIRALLETAKDFQKKKKVKVIIALRQDLISRVFAETADGGFQEEKFRSSCLTLTWTKPQLRSLMEKRLNHLVKRQYTNAPFKLEEVLPTKIDDQDLIEYILSRSLMRPRDVISFLNLAISVSDGKEKIPVRAFRETEPKYSSERLNALRDEWLSDFPEFQDSLSILRNKERCLFGDLYLWQLKERVGSVMHRCLSVERSEISKAAKTLDYKVFSQALVSMWYRLGLVGLQFTPSQSVMWASQNHRELGAEELDENSKLIVHKVGHAGLGIGKLQVNEESEAEEFEAEELS